MNFKTRPLALGGILTALVAVSLLLAAYLPVNRLFFYGISSVFISIIIMEFGISTGWIFYAASSLVSLMVVFNFVRVIPYILFFGLYGIVKFYAEIMKNRILEYTVKLLFFNLAVSAAFLISTELLNFNIASSLPWQALLAGAQIIFLIYDYAYSVFIRYYNQKLKNKIQ